MQQKCLSLYQTAKLEQSRRMSSMIIESGRVSMGTGAPFLPEVFVVVNGMKTLVPVSSSVVQSCLSGGHGFDEVHLVMETQKPPVVQVKNFRVDFFSADLGPQQILELVKFTEINQGTGSALHSIKAAQTSWWFCCFISMYPTGKPYKTRFICPNLTLPVFLLPLPAAMKPASTQAPPLYAVSDLVPCGPDWNVFIWQTEVALNKWFFMALVDCLRGFQTQRFVQHNWSLQWQEWMLWDQSPFGWNMSSDHHVFH